MLYSLQTLLHSTHHVFYPPSGTVPVKVSLETRFYFLVPEGRERWSDQLGPWLLPAAIVVAACMAWILYHSSQPHLMTQGPKAVNKTFQIMPEPTAPRAAVRPARAQPARPVAHTPPKRATSSRPSAPVHPQPTPRPRVRQAPTPTSSFAPSAAAPSSPAAIPEPSSRAPSGPPHVDIGRLEEQMSQAARQATASPPLPKFHNPTGPVAQFYIAGWIQKLERIGDLNYPGEMVGNLKVKVVLNPSGGLERIIMVDPSGNPKLDAAAERIIRLSFPYTPFSAQLKAQTRRIEIPLNMHFLGVRRVNVW